MEEKNRVVYSTQAVPGLEKFVKVISGEKTCLVDLKSLCALAGARIFKVHAEKEGDEPFLVSAINGDRFRSVPLWVARSLAAQFGLKIFTKTGKKKEAVNLTTAEKTTEKKKSRFQMQAVSPTFLRLAILILGTWQKVADYCGVSKPLIYSILRREKNGELVEVLARQGNLLNNRITALVEERGIALLEDKRFSDDQRDMICRILKCTDEECGISNGEDFIDVAEGETSNSEPSVDAAVSVDFESSCCSKEHNTLPEFIRLQIGELSLLISTSLKAEIMIS